MKPKRQPIVIRCHTGDKTVEAIMVGERVAVHPASGFRGWAISDPVSGRAYWLSDYATEADAVRKARQCVRRFGSNPLKGSILKGDRWKRKAKHHDQIREFFR